MKESYPIETAEYAISRGIDDEPLKRRKAIIAALKTQMRQTKHKYGIEIPTSIEHAKELDQNDGSDFWMNALVKEMYNVGVAFEILAEGQPAPRGWHKVTGHLVWDVKMDFTCKARWEWTDIRPQMQKDQCMAALFQENVSGLYSFMLPSTALMYFQPIFTMLTCRHRCRGKIM